MRTVVTLLLVNILWGGEAPPQILKLTLRETPAQFSRALGPVTTVVRGETYRVLQFQGMQDHESYEWEIFMDSTGTPQSLIWNPEKPVPVASLFPRRDRQILTHESGGTIHRAMVRRLSGERVLVASIVSQDQKTINQATLFRAATLTLYLPWVAAKL